MIIQSKKIAAPRFVTGTRREDAGFAAQAVLPVAGRAVRQAVTRLGEQGEIGESIPVAAQLQGALAGDEVLLAGEFLVHRNEDFQVRHLADLPGEMFDVGSHLDVTDQPPIDRPREDVAQREGGQRAKFQAACRLPRSDGLDKGLAVYEVAAAVRLMDA